MTKKFFAALLLLLAVSSQQSALRADDVVRLQPAAGSPNEYSVAELLRVELAGDSIRFIGTDGALVAEVYKYDYVQLTIAETQTTAVEQTKDTAQPPSEGGVVKCRKLIKDGQVYILFGDKAYRIDGTKLK